MHEERYLTIISDRKQITLSVRSILYILMDGKSAQIFVHGGREYRTRRKLQEAAPEHAQYLIDNLQGALPAISLVSELGLSTAYSNDQAPDLVFAQQVLGQGRKGDVLLGISTSGNSGNVLYAADVARAMGIHVIGLTGQKGGKLALCSDVCIKAPSTETYVIQEYHLPIYHALCLSLEEQFFGE